MVRTLRQRVLIPHQTGRQLFDTYLTSKGHAAITSGAKATVSKRQGAAFTAWDGYIEGTNLAVIPSRLVVQSWRTSEFEEDDADSILVLEFSDSARGGVIEMVHANVPDDGADAYDQGWKDSYWTPWKAHAKTLRR